MNEHCKGCFTYYLTPTLPSESHTFCRQHKYNDEGSCPCTNCLVKTTCNTACTDVHNWALDKVLGSVN